MLKLLDHHLADLRRSGLSDATIEAAGIRSVEAKEAKAILNGIDCGPGWACDFPTRDNPNLTPLTIVKPDKPYVFPGKKKNAKYLLPRKAKNRVYIPPMLSMGQLQRPTCDLWITEGCKKALKAVQEGVDCVALSGVDSFTFKDDYGLSHSIPDWDMIWLKGRRVIIANDSDGATKPQVRKAEYRLAVELRKRGAIVAGVHIPPGENGAKVGLDDYLMTHTVAELQALHLDPLDAPPIFTVDQWLAASESDDQEDRPDVKEILPALGKMKPLDYEVVRERVAKVAGVRVSALDSEVEAKRLKKNDPKNGATVAFADVVPWETSVDGVALLDEIADWLRRYVVLPEGAAEAVSAWAIATWLREELYFAPILALSSATKRCGKTVMLELLSQIVSKGILTSGPGITPAVLFRLNDKYHPTILIDEGEKLSGDDSAKELIGMLNAGHRKGGVFYRSAPETHEPTAFDAFGFRVVAAIGPLWDTLTDRAIVIKMARKPQGVKVEHFSSRTVKTEGEILSRKIIRWAADNRTAITNADGRTPRLGWLHDRACDNWSSLFAVGLVTGWLDRLLDSARKLQSLPEDDGDRGELLLRDIQGIFDREGNPEMIESKKLVSALNDIQTSPWGDYRGTGMTTHSLARRLKPFGISPRLSRVDGGQPVRGYCLETFQEAFSRYITPNQSVTVLQPAPVAEIMRFQSVTEDLACNDSKLIKPLIDADCNTVTLQKGEIGGEEELNPQNNGGNGQWDLL